MSDIDTLSLSYMRSTLVKEAFGGQFLGRALSRVGSRIAGKPVVGKQIGEAARRVGSYVQHASGDIGAGAGVGGAVGGLTGAVGGGVQGYEEGGVGGALSRGLSGGLRGATIGAGVGAGAGLLGGGRVTGSEAGKAFMSSPGILGASGRFGQRQLHSVTGMAPGGAKRLLPTGEVNPQYVSAVKGMGGAPTDAAKRLTSAKDALTRAQESGVSPRKLQSLERQATRAEKGLQVSDEAVERGLTSVPGMVQAVRKEGLKPLWTHGLKPQLTQQGWQGKAIAGLPAAMALPELAVETDDSGRGRAERFGRALGQGGAFAATPFVPLAGSEVLSRGAGGAGGMVGKGIDRLIGAVKPKKPQEFGESPGVPATDGDSSGGIAVERVVSNAAQGKPPEDLLT